MMSTWKILLCLSLPLVLYLLHCSTYRNLVPKFTQNCEPIVEFRQYSQANKSFIAVELKKLLEDDVDESSRSPWRAQVVVVRTGVKTQMCIDYSQTINLYNNNNNSSIYKAPKSDMSL